MNKERMFYQSIVPKLDAHIDTYLEEVMTYYETHEVINEHASSFQSNLVFQSAHTPYFSFWIARLQAKLSKRAEREVPVIVVVPSNEQSRYLHRNMEIFSRIEEISLKDHDGLLDKNSHVIHKNSHAVYKNILLPSWGNEFGAPISEFAPIRTERASSLHAIATHTPQVLICSIEQWEQLLPPKESFTERTIIVQKGEIFDSIKLSEMLTTWKYTRVPHVCNEGEYALRGEVLDVFISKNVNGQAIASPIRITFEFDTIETIKFFDASTQLSQNEVESVCLHPRSEYVWNDDSIVLLKDNITHLFPEISTIALNECIQTISEKGYDEWEYLYAMFASKTQEHITDYFEQKPLVLFTHYEMLSKQRTFYWNKQKDFFLSMGNIQCIPRYTRLQELLRTTSTHRTLAVPIFRNTTITNHIAIGDSPAPRFSGNISYFTKYAQEKKDEDYTLFISTDQAIYQEKIMALLKSGFDEEDQEKALGVDFLISDIPSGFVLPRDTIECYTEIDLLGKKLHFFDDAHTSPIASIQQIEKGDHVVHMQYGIGMFLQLIRLSIMGTEKDFIQLEYAHKEKLYVPIEQMNMIQRYLGQAREKIILDSIGGKAWESRKQKAIQKIEDMSQELLDLHAKRNSIPGFAFLSGEEWEKEFIDAFPFQETVDQELAWKEISADMENPIPMDRLLVGDVGFGKTELAFRTAFRAISAGKQAAFLVPTTILAEQHLNSAVDRFRSFPIEIAMLSRFLSAGAQAQVIEKIKKGKVDLIIGTHRIIQKDIQFKALGVCIIDEEHRFGVKDKEYIKKYYPNIDCLSLSATPIPRTLYQSMTQLRDMSVLKTPPLKRKPIRTFVEKFDESLIAKAIKSEIARGGQVFFLHNRIKSLEQVRNFIEELVHEATVLTASGQMSSKDLEDTMYRFIHKGANVLVSTTIIENGIDIPSVNTIIIDRADNYGVAQLYQLRGRVGRSDQTSFAYLLYPDEYSLSEIALKRLSTISDNSELGAGFQIAMRDLEVRGTGNLLGKEQSGSIYAIGYEYYMQLFDQTMKKVKGLPLSAPEPVLELNYTGFIPSTYILDVGTKMDIYKQIVSVKTLEEYETLTHDFEDKYGPFPQEMRNLFWISKLRILCSTLYISHLKETPKEIALHFSNIAKISSRNVARLLESGVIYIKPSLSHIIMVPLPSESSGISLEMKYNILEEILTSIIGNK